jgi:hypothetical protein
LAVLGQPGQTGCWCGSAAEAEDVSEMHADLASGQALGIQRQHLIDTDLTVADEWTGEPGPGC